MVSRFELDVFLPLMIKTSSKPMVISAEVVEVVVIVLPIMVDYLPHTS